MLRLQGDGRNGSGQALLGISRGQLEAHDEEDTGGLIQGVAMKLLAAVKESWYKQRGHWWERRVLKPRDLALRRLTPQRKGALRP